LQIGREAFTGPEPIHHAHPDEHRDRGNHNGVQQRLETDASQVSQIAQPRNPQHQCGKDERHDQHEQKAEEDLAGGPGDVLEERLQHRIPGEKCGGSSPQGGSCGSARQNPDVEGHSHGRSIP
jgi:hypothetical protein